MIHILTGEYPPMPGGVSDYSALLAAELASSVDGVCVHRVDGLARLEKRLNSMPRPRRLLVQWTPHAFGMRSLNVPFAAWLWKRAHLNHDRVEVMVHEPFLAFGEGGWRHHAAAAVHRVMIALVLDAASKVWVSIPAWESLLRPWCLRGSKEFEWLPVPCNVASEADTQTVTRLRRDLTPGGELLVGHFGTYRQDIESLLSPALIELLEGSNVKVLLAGNGSDHYHGWFTGEHPRFHDRVITTGSLPGAELAATLSACDVLLQPYPDGISTRRGSAMTALALGVPVVTNLGRLSERLWAEAAVAVAESSSPSDLAGETLRLLADADRRAALSVRSRELYRLRFDVRHTVAALLREPAPARLLAAPVAA